MAHATLTPQIAYAAGQDAGNRSMRKAGRTKWNRTDYNAAAHETNRLMAALFTSAGHPDIAAKIAELA